MSNDVPITAGAGTNVETLQQADADLSHRQVMHVGDMKAAILLALDALLNPLHVDASARMRVSVENIAGSLTLSTVTSVGSITTVGTVTTVTTVGAVTNLAKIGGFFADQMILDTMQNTWANSVRGQIQ